MTISKGTRIAWTPARRRVGVVVEAAELDGKPGYDVVLDDTAMPGTPLWCPAEEIEPEQQQGAEMTTELIAEVYDTTWWIGHLTAHYGGRWIAVPELLWDREAVQVAADATGWQIIETKRDTTYWWVQLERRSITGGCVVINCARCKKPCDVSTLVERVEREGRRPAGWRPKLCFTCVWDALDKLGQEAAS